MTKQNEKTIAVIGGGISGLAAAYRLIKLASENDTPAIKVILLEAGPKLGGVLQTESIDGYLVEQSADMFTTDPPFAMELCHELGKLDELLETIPTPDRAYVATTDSMHPVPRGFSLMAPGNLDAVLESSLLTDEDKKRFLEEAQIPAAVHANAKDESLESFAVRRFGQAMFDKLIQPLASGIYTADPAKLSMNATMKRFIDMERKHGSLTKAVAAASTKTDRQASGARYGLFRSPKMGVGKLVDWIVDYLDQNESFEVRKSCSANSISKTESGWTIEIDSGNSVSADGIVVATPAKPASALVSNIDSELAGQLAKIETASSAIVILGVDESQIKNRFDGYGIITPSILNRKTIAISFSSNKFSGRTPDAKILIRCFIGGALQSELVDLNDEELINIGIKELDQTVGFSGQPELTKVVRWKNCMPQYHLGHLDRVEQIEKRVAQLSCFELAGNSYRGVGIPACVESGFKAANRCASELFRDS